MRSVMRVLLGAAVASMLVLAAPAGAEDLRFGQPKYIDDTYAGGEPVLLTDTIHHRIVYSSHEGTTHIYRPGLLATSTLGYVLTYRNQVKIWSSGDGGETWERASMAGSGFANPPNQNTGFSDPDLTMDAGGRIYNTGINLANDALFSSADGGITWDRGTALCATGDRPWLAGGKKDEVFMITATLESGEQMIRSGDGGNTCEGGAEGGGSRIPVAGDGWSGNGKHYYDHAHDLIVSPAQGEWGMGVAVWRRGQAAFTPKPAIDHNDYFAHWPAIALDGAGTIYLVYDTSGRGEGAGACEGFARRVPNEIHMLVSKDLGETWSAPIKVAAPSNAFAFWPWITAGDAGKVNVSWYQTDKLVDIDCETADIHAYSTTITDASSESRRFFGPVDVAGRAIARSHVCQAGTGCVTNGGDRRLGDFFTNAIDERGCVIVATADTMQPDPVTGGERATALPLFVKQTTGPRLIGEGNCSGIPDPPAPPAVAPKVKAPSLGLPSSRRCLSRRVFDIRLRAPKGQRLARATVTVAGKRVKVRKRGGRLVARVDLRRVRKGRFAVKVVALTGQGRQVTETRRYRTCAPKRR